MSWKVVWKPEAERRLTATWLGSRRRYAITAAARELDAALVVDPENMGESREENRRVVFVEPLGARIELDHVTHTVSVLTIWDY